MGVQISLKPNESIIEAAVVQYLDQEIAKVHGQVQTCNRNIQYCRENNRTETWEYEGWCNKQVRMTAVLRFLQDVRTYF